MKPPAVIKPAGRTATGARRRTMHGTSHEWRYQAIDGGLRRNDEKPGFFHKRRRP